VATASVIETAPAHAPANRPNMVSVGTIVWLASELMFFAALFAMYFTLRAVNPDIWFEETPKLALPFATVNTIILVLSSVTCQLGVWGIMKDDRRKFLRNFAVTLVLGIVFLLIQLYDYSVLIHEGLTMGSTTFGTTYYTMTGFHFAHVFGGVLMLGVVLYRGMAGQFSAKHNDMVEATSLYWHFVDVVWILLFSVLYLL